jgi:hypothetical protein
MPVEDAETLATFFDEDEFAIAATYTPSGGGAAVACSIIIDAPQEVQGLGVAGIVQTNRRVMVRKSEVANPADGTLTIDGTSYSIVEPELDITEKIWSFGLKP